MPPAASQGYITIAAEHQRYVDMAVVLALSLKTCDPGRPVCLVYDDHVQLPPQVDRIFDHLVKLQPDPDYRGCLKKLRLDDWSPYERTMFIDADCLLMKAQVDTYWSACAGRGFAATGLMWTRGRWLGLDVERLCQRFDCPYVVILNTGTFYFEKGEPGTRFFAELRRLYADRRDELRRDHRGQAGYYADEPFFGVAMGRLGLEPVAEDARAGPWMLTTWRAQGLEFDADRGLSVVHTPSRHWLPATVRYVPRSWVTFLEGSVAGWVKQSPVFLHFIGMKPKARYLEFAERVKAKHAARLQAS
jgi:hypothetical protein